MSLAALGDGLETCLAEVWPQNQITCLAGFATEAGDPAVCLRSGDPAVRWRCVADYAEKVGDAASCTILPADDLEAPGVAGDLCRAHLAISWRKPALCLELTTPNLADACLLQLAEMDGDKALCGRIENEILAESCREL